MRVILPALCLAAAAGCWSWSARAEGPAVNALATVQSLPSPPPGFDPVSASDADLARYGLPSRPDPFTGRSVSYSTWLHAMRHARTRVEPQIRVTNHQHVPAMTLRRLPGIQSSTMASTNWSGEMLLSGASSFGAASYTEVLAQWLVSAVQQPPGSCGGTDVSAAWVGIDGAAASSADVLQAGTEADTGCSNGITTQNYYPWFEWYPAYEYEITNFTMYRGASVFVVVQATGSTTANVTFVNLQNDSYTVAKVTAPAGTSLKGSSAEWIIERPTVNNTLGTLADFGLTQMSSEVAYVASQINTGNYDVPGSPKGGRVGYMINMVDENGNPLATSSPLGTFAQVVSVQGAAQ